MTLFEEKLQPLAEYLEAELKSELQKQGHVATGKLYDSIKVTVGKEDYRELIVGSSGEADYGQYVERGRKINEKQVPLDALKDWVKVKGLATEDDEILQIACKIRNAIYKNGIPTDKKEEKKKFVTRTLENNKEKIRTTIAETYHNQVQEEINNMVKLVNKQ